MNQASLPGPAQWRACLGRTFALAPPACSENVAAHAELVDVYECVAMNKHYVSYAAQFALPPDVRLAQSTYSVSESHVNGTQAAPQIRDAWLLLLTPVLPGDDGRARMEAVFHVPSHAVAAAVTPPAMEEREPVVSPVTRTGCSPVS